MVHDTDVVRYGNRTSNKTNLVGFRQLLVSEPLLVLEHYYTIPSIYVAKNFNPQFYHVLEWEIENTHSLNKLPQKSHKNSN